MDNRKRSFQSNGFIPFIIVSALTIAALLTVRLVPAEGSSSLPAAIYLHGWLRLNIPYRAPSTGTGGLIVEVLNPDDQVLGHAERQLSVSAGPGTLEGQNQADQISAAEPTGQTPGKLANVGTMSHYRRRVQYSGRLLPWATAQIVIMDSPSE